MPEPETEPEPALIEWLAEEAGHVIAMTQDLNDALENESVVEVVASLVDIGATVQCMIARCRSEGAPDG